MFEPREQLIAAWRQQLTDAESVEPEPASRAAWLRRLQRRLYHFLLSLYGEGNWNAPDSSKLPRKQSEVALLPDVDLPHVRHGVKDISEVRHVLNSVASAQGHRPAQGKLAREYFRHTWVRVASYQQDLDPQACCDALLAQGIRTRAVEHAGAMFIEVQLQNQWRAESFVALNRHQLLTQSARQAAAEREQAARARNAAVAVVIESYVDTLLHLILIVVFSALVAVPLVYAVVEFKLMHVDSDGLAIAGGGFAVLVLLLYTQHRLRQRRNRRQR